jgi:hypothetical protein
MVELERDELGKCVVCCKPTGTDGYFGEYCDIHRVKGDDSMPPIPLKEWWPEQHLPRYYTWDDS